MQPLVRRLAVLDEEVSQDLLSQQGNLSWKFPLNQHPARSSSCALIGTSLHVADKDVQNLLSASVAVAKCKLINVSPMVGWLYFLFSWLCDELLFVLLAVLLEYSLCFQQELTDLILSSN